MSYPPQPKFGVRDFLAQIAAYALALVPGFILQAYVPDGEHVGWTPFILGLMVGVGCGALLSLPLFLIVRNKQNLGYAMIVFIYAIAWLGPLVVRYFNMGLDSSPRVARTLTVLELEKRAKGSPQITLEHWDAGESPFTIDGNYKPGETVTIYTHSGNLGFEWIELPGDAYQNERRKLVR